MNQYKASKEEVKTFLERLVSLLNSPNFNIEKDFIFGGKYERMKNTQTLLELDFEKEDVIGVLKKLTIFDYYQSFPDDKNSKMPHFHVFFVSILEREIYIKIRIQNVNNVLCISFHFSEYSHGKMPY